MNYLHRTTSESRLTAIRASIVLVVFVLFIWAYVTAQAHGGQGAASLVTKLIPKTNSTPQIVYSSILISWDSYTNVSFPVMGTTNLVDWYLVTNVPIPALSVSVPMNKQQEFFKVGIQINK